VIPIGFFRGRRAFGPAHRQPGNDQRWNVGEVMNGIADERDRVACVAGDQFGCDQDERRYHRDAQNARHPFQWQVNVRMAAQAVTVAMFVGVGVAVVMRMVVHR